MKYDKWITQEVRLNCKHQDMGEYAFQLYVEMVKQELLRKKECKKHKWMMGAGMGCMIVKKKLISPLYRNIWCTKCDKTIKANLYSDYELAKMNNPNNKKGWGRTY